MSKDVSRGQANRESNIIRGCGELIFNPAEFIGKNWSVWKGPINGDGLAGEPDIDERSIGLTEVDMSKVLFETMLKAGEPVIAGDEKIRRLKQKSHIRLGGNVFLALWKDRQENEKNSVLWWLKRVRNVECFDLPGLILRAPNGYDRCVLCFDGFHWCCRVLGGWDSSKRPSGVLASDSAESPTG